MSFILSTSIPKSGTHLMTTVLQFLTEEQPFPIRKMASWDAFDSAMYEKHRLLYGHLRLENLRSSELLKQLFSNRKIFVLIRDPRDICVSMLHHLEMSQDPAHQRIAALIPAADFATKVMFVANGVSIPGESFRVASLTKHCEGFLEILTAFPDACVIRYEDFFGDLAGRKISQHLGATPMEVQACIDRALKANTKTKRVGKPAGWESLFDNDLRQFFACNFSGIIQKLGYIA